MNSCNFSSELISRNNGWLHNSRFLCSSKGWYMVDAYKLLRLPLKQHWTFVCGKKIKRCKPGFARTSAHASGAARSI
jgi:hypothetical protein